MLFINRVGPDNAASGPTSRCPDLHGGQRITLGLPGGSACLGEHLLEHLGNSAPNAARSQCPGDLMALPSGTYLAPRFNQKGKPRLPAQLKKALDPAIARRPANSPPEPTGRRCQKTSESSVTAQAFLPESPR